MSLHTSNETFLSRWARLKRSGESAKPGPLASARQATGGMTAAESNAPIAPLPDVETLCFGDDFSGFLRQEVEESVKRVALKKLFHSAEFNVMDGLDIYIDDYTIPSPIDEATIRQLAHAKDLLFSDEKVASEQVPTIDEDAIEPAAAVCAEPVEARSTAEPVA